MNSNFIDEYVDYCLEQTDAPRIFHHWLAYMVVSSVINRNCYRPFGWRRLYPNLYLLIIAPSSAHRKSWSMNIAARMIKSVHQRFIIPEVSSREAFVSELADTERTPFGCGLVKIDELKGFMDRVRTKSYMEGFTQDLSTLYDGTSIDRRKGIDKVERFVVDDPFLNIMAACSTDWLYQSVQSGDISGGFFARFLWIVHDQKIKDPSPFPKAENPEKFRSLIERLYRIRDYIARIDFSPEADSIYSQWYRQFYNRHQGGMWDGNYHRACTTIQKLSIINAVVRAESIFGSGAGLTQVDISASDVKSAIEMVEDTLLNFNKMTIGVNKFDTIKMKVLKYIVHHGPVSRGRILTGVRDVSGRFLTDILSTLEETGTIKIDRDGKGMTLEATEMAGKYLGG